MVAQGFRSGHDQGRSQNITGLSSFSKLRKGTNYGAHNFGITHLASVLMVMVGKVTGYDPKNNSGVFDSVPVQDATKFGGDHNSFEIKSDTRDGVGVPTESWDLRIQELEDAIEEATRKCSTLQGKIDKTNAENRALRAKARANGQL